MMRVFDVLPAETEHVSKLAVDAAIKVHRALGPGLLESVYETCLAHELRRCGLLIETQVPIPIVYDGIHLEAGLRIDLLVAKQLIIEVKAVEQMNRIFRAQVLTYLKLTGLRLALLINFNVLLVKDGIERIILCVRATRGNSTRTPPTQAMRRRRWVCRRFSSSPLKNALCLRVFVVKDSYPSTPRNFADVPA
jgi:GxxExxY protein